MFARNGKVSIHDLVKERGKLNYYPPFCQEFLPCLASGTILFLRTQFIYNKGAIDSGPGLDNIHEAIIPKPLWGRNLKRSGRESGLVGKSLYFLLLQIRQIGYNPFLGWGLGLVDPE